MQEIISQQLLDLMKSIFLVAKRNSIPLKLFGGAAVFMKCPQGHELLAKLNRKINDLDFISDIKYKSKLTRLLVTELDLIPDNRFETIPSNYQSVFYNKNMERICDLNYNILHYSHKLNLKSSLNNNHDTISITEILISKFQVHELTQKDVIDIIVILNEYDFSNTDEYSINPSRILELCNNDWGLEHTIKINCCKVHHCLDSPEIKSLINKIYLTKKISFLLSVLRNSHKTIKWKIRGHFKEKYQWYDSVENE